MEPGPDEKDERVYDLNPMRARQFQFVYGLKSGIADVAVKKLRLTVYGKKEHLVLDADPTYNKHAVFDLLDKLAKGIRLTQKVSMRQPEARSSILRRGKRRAPGRGH